jgi:hypothetical protein
MKKSLIAATLAMVLLVSGCASPAAEVVAEVEAPFLPTTSLTQGLGINPKPFTSDLDKLQKSYDFYEVTEASAGGDLDYSLDWQGQFGSVGTLSDEAQASNRERDQVNLAFNAPDLEVYLDGTTSFFVFLTINSQGEEVTAFCNGILFEVAGEAFKIPGEEDCFDNRQDEFSFDSFSFFFGDNYSWDSENAEVTRMFQLLAQNSFRVKVVDTEGKEHVFTYDISREFPSPQDFFRIAFEADLAVKAGLGY